jgi:hypothetical protein
VAATRKTLRRGVVGRVVLLTCFLATRSRCQAEAGDGWLTLRLGWLRIRTPLENIACVERRPTGLRYQLARASRLQFAEELTLAYGSGDHLLVTLKEPVRVLLLRYPAISFATEDDDAIVRAIGRRDASTGA